jgi:hypothetical protein
VANRQLLQSAATDVLVAGWRCVQRGQVDSRSPLGDALLGLRDVLNPNWPNDPDWLPDELRAENERVVG